MVKPTDTISPKDLAAILGVSESSVKRWVDRGRIQAIRTDGGHRRIPMVEVSRITREEDMVVADFAPLGFRIERNMVFHPPASQLDRMITALVEGYAERAVYIVLPYLINGHPPAVLLDEVLWPAWRALRDHRLPGGTRPVDLARAAEIAISVAEQCRCFLVHETQQPTVRVLAPDSPAGQAVFAMLSLALAESGLRAVATGSAVHDAESAVLVAITGDDQAHSQRLADLPHGTLIIEDVATAPATAQVAHSPGRLAALAKERFGAVTA